MKLTNEQITILEDWRIEDNKFYLQGQLDRKQYKSINDVLETIGLKRNRKEKAHIADDITEEELKEAIDDIVETGEVETLKETIKKFQFYETPKEVAEYLVELADINDDDNVLEPSAWHGAIVDALLPKLQTNSHENVCIVLTELNPDNIKILKDKYDFGINWLKDIVDGRSTYLSKHKMNIYHCDFLENHLNKEAFSKIVMNPPFSKSQDVKHILEAYTLLDKWWRLVSVASASIKYRTWKPYDQFNELNPEFYDLPDGSFKQSGTMVNTVIVVIDK